MYEVDFCQRNVGWLLGQREGKLELRVRIGGGRQTRGHIFAARLHLLNS